MGEAAARGTAASLPLGDFDGAVLVVVACP